MVLTRSVSIYNIWISDIVGFVGCDVPLKQWKTSCPPQFCLITLKPQSLGRHWVSHSADKQLNLTELFIHSCWCCGNAVQVWHNLQHLSTLKKEQRGICCQLSLMQSHTAWSFKWPNTCSAQLRLVSDLNSQNKCCQCVFLQTIVAI